METNWLQEMMKLSGVQTEPDEAELNEPYIPGMIPDWDDETFEKMRGLALAIDQTMQLIEEQDAMQEDLQEERADAQNSADIGNFYTE